MAKRQRSGPTFIGLSRQVASEQKAIWHNVTGAGRRGVIRQFFDVNEEDQTAFAQGLEKLIQARLKEQAS
jgi:hypothetical protein